MQKLSDKSFSRKVVPFLVVCMVLLLYVWGVSTIVTGRWPGCLCRLCPLLWRIPGEDPSASAGDPDHAVCRRGSGHDPFTDHDVWTDPCGSGAGFGLSHRSGSPGEEGGAQQDSAAAS